MQQNWTETEGKLFKIFKFNTFKEAVEWMNFCVSEIDLADHHPNWENIYNSVIVKLYTHTTNSITEKDYSLAELLDKKYFEYRVRK